MTGSSKLTKPGNKELGYTHAAKLTQPMFSLARQAMKILLHACMHASEFLSPFRYTTSVFFPFLCYNFFALAELKSKVKTDRTDRATMKKENENCDALSSMFIDSLYGTSRVKKNETAASWSFIIYQVNCMTYRLPGDIWVVGHAVRRSSIIYHFLFGYFCESSSESL